MPSFELSKLQAVDRPRALSEADRAPIDLGASTRSSALSTTSAGGAGVLIEVSASVDPAKPPINEDRVADIRAALRDGRYPLVPTQIADAMIAAQLSYEVQR